MKKPIKKMKDLSEWLVRTELITCFSMFACAFICLYWLKVAWLAGLIIFLCFFIISLVSWIVVYFDPHGVFITFDKAGMSVVTKKTNAILFTTMTIVFFVIFISIINAAG